LFFPLLQRPPWIERPLDPKLLNIKFTRVCPSYMECCKKLTIKIVFLPEASNFLSHHAIPLPFQQIFSSHLVMNYDGKRLFSSATPHSIRIWAEADLEACEKTTHEYIRTHRHQRSLSPPHDNHGSSANGVDGPSRSGTQDLSDASDAEPLDSQDSQKFKLTFRSAGTSKDITLTVKPTTTCKAIVKAFLKSAGLSDQYPAVATGQTPKKGKKAEKVPMLCLDGDKLDLDSKIGDADLEDGDMVEVVDL